MARRRSYKPNRYTHSRITPRPKLVRRQPVNIVGDYAPPPRTSILGRNEPAIYVSTRRASQTPTQVRLTWRRPRPLVRKQFKGWQPARRVDLCAKKRERRRRAYFGFLQTPHAGKSNGKKHSDRFTVKC